jgi:uncharacterized protein YkwD
MRGLSWIGGIVVVVVVGTATAATLRAQNDSAPPLTASNAPVAVAFQGSYGADPRSEHHLPRLSPDASPIPSALKAAGPPWQAVPPPPPARHSPPIVIGSTQQVLINQDRGGAGLGPLTWSSCLYNVALSNARRMAAQGYISHANGPNLDLSCGLGYQAGENVGYWSAGINDSQLNSMFMNSPDHRANIMGPYHYVATAWAVAPNGYAYIAVEFG